MRPAGAADDRRGEREQVVDGHRDRGVVAVDTTMPAESPTSSTGMPGVVEDPRGQRVVGGEHGPLLAAGLGGGDVADGDPPGGRPP